MPVKIHSFEIDGLFGRSEKVRHVLEPDMAILTGRNGAGKTSVLKLLWSIVSGNILIALDEIEFKTTKISTEDYECTVHKIGRRSCKVELETKTEHYFYVEDFDTDGDTILNADDLANSKLIEFYKSVFFPTFRRIEGGFSISPRRNALASTNRQLRARNDLEEALVSLSRGLTHDPHIFVSAISTVDIVTLLLRKYADLSEESN